MQLKKMAAKVRRLLYTSREARQRCTLKEKETHFNIILFSNRNNFLQYDKKRKKERRVGIGSFRNSVKASMCACIQCFYSDKTPQQNA